MHSSNFSLLALLIIFLCFSDVVLTLPAPAKTKGKTPAKLPAKNPTKKVTPPAKKVTPPAKKVTPLAKKVTTSTKKVTTPTKKVATPVKQVTPPATKVTTPTQKVTTSPAVNNATSGLGTKKTTSSGLGLKTSATSKSPTKTTPLPNSTSATKPTPSSCPLNADSPPPSGASSRTSSPGTSGKKKKTREFDDSDFKGLFRRDKYEFVGFHGTNGANGHLYQQASQKKNGQIPVLFQFNGNDGELGGGLYITDDFLIAKSFGLTSANNRKTQATTGGCSLAPGADLGVVCKVEAKVSSTFRSTVSKVWIPVGEIARPVPGQGNNPEGLKKQEDRIKSAGMNPKNTLRFSALDQTNPGNPNIGNQIMLPPGAFPQFVIRQCLPATVDASAFNAPDFPQFNYRAKTAEWNIRGDPLEQV
ncbi:hypothetical protein PQX77_020028 [Marasmius sp. AFHP31]|nr:hypothetical protein PQX77_020028 [Marasmius sp. AFHP31]